MFGLKIFEKSTLCRRESLKNYDFLSGNIKKKSNKNPRLFVLKKAISWEKLIGSVKKLRIFGKHS